MRSCGSGCSRTRKAQAKKNISYHYDLGNDFYRLWLDETMTYSSALFRTGQESLETAQIAEIRQHGRPDGRAARRSCAGDRLRLGRVCRICGEGAGAAGHRADDQPGAARLCGRADRARRACRDRVEIKLQDYRDERGTYDGIASIEMFEAVGEKYWPVYFDTLRDRLKPGAQRDAADHHRAGRALGGLQARRGFHPEIHLPGRDAARAVGPARRGGAGGAEGQAARSSSAKATARRCGAGTRRSTTAGTRWRSMGFDDRFRRMWNFYLTSCAGAFQGGNCDVTQITVTRPQTAP